MKWNAEFNMEFRGIEAEDGLEVEAKMRKWFDGVRFLKGEAPIASRMIITAVEPSRDREASGE